METRTNYVVQNKLQSTEKITEIHYHEGTIRAYKKNGVVWFSLNDVLVALEHPKPYLWGFAWALKYLEDDQKSIAEDNDGQDFVAIDEAGVLTIVSYGLLQATLEQPAKTFRRWFVRMCLPQMHGSKVVGY